ncbi:PIN domain-containing protein [Bacillus amyloliquefaciens]|uniref:PIN domain-containing protein n=1 Tax=Bacillus amyloliquefaciens TaxID=1390 RepID=UPI003A8C7984
MYPQYYITVDTNILLDMLEPKKYDDKTFNSFISGLRTRTFKLILPELVLEEWQKHKEKNLKRFIQSTIKETDDLIKKIEKLESDMSSKELLIKLKQKKIMESRKYTYSYGLRGRMLDKLLYVEFYCTIINRTPKSDTEVVSFAIQKKAPFFSTEGKGAQNKVKSEAADASIFFSTCEYFHQNKMHFEKGRYFVTNNKKDFSDNFNPSKPHNNLESYLHQANLNYSNNLKAVIKDIVNPAFIIDHVISEPDTELLVDKNFSKCHNCNFDVHLTMDSFVPENRHPYEATYWLRCLNCSYEWDTGDPYVDE